MSVFIQHNSHQLKEEDVSIGGPFSKLCEIFSKERYFADSLLDHNSIDLAVYAQFISLAGPAIVTNKKKFLHNCSVLPLSDLMSVPEEAFALLVLENCFQQWKWAALEKIKKSRMGGRDHEGALILSSISSSSRSLKLSNDLPTCSTSSTCSVSPRRSVTCNDTKVSTRSEAKKDKNRKNQEETDGNKEDNNAKDNDVSSVSTDATRKVHLQDSPHSSSGTIGEGGSYCDSDNDSSTAEDRDSGSYSTSVVGPGYIYQYQVVRRDNRLGAGPWTQEGLKRFNDIVMRVMSVRKVRSRFEEHLRLHIEEQELKNSGSWQQKKAKRVTSKRAAIDMENGRGSPKKVVVIDLFSNEDDD